GSGSLSSCSSCDSCDTRARDRCSWDRCHDDRCCDWDRRGDRSWWAAWWWDNPGAGWSPGLSAAPAYAAPAASPSFASAGENYDMPSTRRAEPEQETAGLRAWKRAGLLHEQVRQEALKPRRMRFDENEYEKSRRSGSPLALQGNHRAPVTVIWSADAL